VLQLRDAVRDLLSKGQKYILLNLGRCELHRQLGIGRTRQLPTPRSQPGRRTEALNLTKKVHDLLQITKLYTVFDVKGR